MERTAATPAIVDEHSDEVELWGGDGPRGADFVAAQRAAAEVLGPVKTETGSLATPTNVDEQNDEVEHWGADGPRHVVVVGVGTPGPPLLLHASPFVFVFVFRGSF